IKDSKEECDTNNFGSALTGSCSQFSSSFLAGSLKCTNECKIDTKECTISGVCSNGFIDLGANEQCDGKNFGALTGTCVNFNSNSFNGGNLTCNPQTCQIDTSNCIGKTCGDGLINRPGEECDKNTFGLIKSCTQYTNFIGGNLQCSNDCKIDTSGCKRLPNCGNKEIDPSETCDGALFGIIKACSGYNNSFNGGTLKCTSTCQVDTSSCTEKPSCGNSFIDKGESCDGTNFGPIAGTCNDYNPSLFSAGNLLCNRCKIDTSNCQGVNGICGDNSINIGEACDGANLGKLSVECSEYSSSFQGGTLKCSTDCKQLDTSSCTEKPSCGNSFIDKGESCDGINLGLTSNKCADYSNDFKEGELQCLDDCKLDTSKCVKSPSCGNQRLDTGETCDGTNFGDIKDLSCSAYSNSFSEGTLKCSSSCQIDTSGCKEKPKCGNFAIESGEQCESQQLGDKTCQSFGFVRGNLSCDSACQFNTASCIMPPPCGNSKLDQGEVCDDSGPVYGAIKSCFFFNNFIGGNLSCNNCEIDKTNCIVQPFCGDKIIQKGENCDGKLFGVLDSCVDMGFASGSLGCAPSCLLDTSKCQPKPSCGNGII
ncbi:hypothetical protein HYY70_04335, partial [Candidatus Woesearchaeota archaeon]|nr:hypothetical protein [Candidatus Woesearchaeota archaeon]